jgi:hypothetical protein
MFEKEISSYAFNISKRYTGERIALGSLLIDVELPDSFKKFAEAEVEGMIDEEGLVDSRTGRLNWTNPQVQALFKEIRHVLKNYFEFSKEEFLELAEKASKFIFNYVIRPRWTLEKFLFKGETEIDKLSIEKAARFFNDYLYYPREIAEYLEFHKKSTLDIATWKKLHAKIDEHLLSMLPSSLDNLTASLFKMFQFAAGDEKVPTDAVILFFRDKSATEILDRVEFAKEINNIQSLNLPDLEMILHATSKEVSQKIDLLPSVEEPPIDFRTFERQTVTMPLMSETNQKLKIPVEVGMNSSQNDSHSEENSDLKASEHFLSEQGQQLDQQLLSEPEKKKEETSSVRTHLTAKQESRIIKKIFGGSKSGYHIAIYKLDASPNWKSASKIVEGIFIDNGIDPFSKYSVVFTEAVSAKFLLEK